MNSILFFIATFTLLLFSLFNVIFLTINEKKQKHFVKNLYYGILFLFAFGVLFSLALIKGLTIIDWFLFVCIAIFGNPLIFVFPFSNIREKIGPRLKKLLSKFFLIYYGLILIFGLLGMAFPANTWGNSILIYGIILTVWSLPNILLATVMHIDYRFAGLFRMVTGSLALINISIALSNSDYSGSFENRLKLVSFLTAIYFLFEGYLFLSKHKRSANH
jgi:hypothetical protein